MRRKPKTRAHEDFVDALRSWLGLRPLYRDTSGAGGIDTHERLPTWRDFWGWLAQRGRHHDK